jgi:hypothetical protein
MASNLNKRTDLSKDFPVTIYRDPSEGSFDDPVFRYIIRITESESEELLLKISESVCKENPFDSPHKAPSEGPKFRGTQNKQDEDDFGVLWNSY